MKQITPHIGRRLALALGLTAALGVLVSPLFVLPAIVLGISLLRPRTVGMPILALLIPVQFFVSSFGLTFSFVDVLILLLAVVLLFQTLALRKQFRWGPLWLPFLVFGAGLVIAAVRSSDFPAASTQVMRLSSYGLVYLLVLNFTDSCADARRILISMFIAGTGVAILGISQSILGHSFTREFLASRLGKILVYGDTPIWVISSMQVGDFVRAYGLFMNPNWCGTYLAMLLVMALPLQLRQQVAVPWRWMRGISVLWFAAFVLTLSRGAMVGFVCAIIAFFTRMGTGRFIAVLGLVGILVLSVSLISTEMLGPLEHLRWQNLDWQGTAGYSRMSLWRDAYRVLATSPLAGVGLGNYEQKLSTMTYGAWIVHPHSTYLQLLIEGGIPTCLAFIWILWTVWAKHWSMAKHLAPGLSRAVAMGAASAKRRGPILRGSQSGYGFLDDSGPCHAIDGDERKEKVGQIQIRSQADCLRFLNAKKLKHWLRRTPVRSL